LLAALWQGSLQIDQVGREDSFFELGGHSLLAVKVLQKINSCSGCALRVLDLYQNPTIRQLARRIEGLKSDDHLIDLSQEATLGADIVPASRKSLSPPQTILLTGATGFVGRFLLVRLLEDTQAKVFCLARSTSRSEAAARLRATLERNGLWRHEFGRRIVPICGNMALPRLGLDATAYGEVCLEADAIYHCATSMNHLETYSMAKPANVDGIGEILRIATVSRPKLFNYISTLGVFSRPEIPGTRVVRELTSIEHERHRASQGYAASKWVGEKLLMIAGQRSVPCNILRLGLVWADSEYGRYDELQREHRIWRSCLLSGFGIRDYAYDPPPTPVDYVARAVAWLASQHSNGGGIFHLCSSLPPIHNIFGIFYDWIREMQRLHTEGRSLPAVPLIEYAFSMDESSFNDDQKRLHATALHFDCTQTEEELRTAGIVMPEFSDDLVRRSVKTIRPQHA
jgi:thioester reductase-like protein